MRADIELKEAQRDKVRQDWRYDPSRVLIQAVLATAAIVGALGTVVGYLLRGQTH